MSVIPDLSLRINKSERLPCVLIVDGSTSMSSNNAVKNLNEGLVYLAQTLKEDDDTAFGVQIAIISMGGNDDVTELTPFVDAADFIAPVVKANGSTPLGKAVDYAMAMIEQQKQQYKLNGIPYKRPWLWIMSDGAPTDSWQDAATRARAGQAERRFILWAIGVGNDAPLAALQAFTVPNLEGKLERCFRLGQRDIKDLFEWFSNSVGAGARAAQSEQVAMPQRPVSIDKVEW